MALCKAVFPKLIPMLSLGIPSRAALGKPAIWAKTHHNNFLRQSSHRPFCTATRCMHEQHETSPSFEQRQKGHKRGQPKPEIPEIKSLDATLWGGAVEGKEETRAKEVIEKIAETVKEVEPEHELLQEIVHRPMQRPDRRVGLTRKIQAKLVKQPAAQPDNPKVLKVAIIGAPNAGKSTLVNKLLNWKVSAVSEKPHTTRHRTLGVLTEGDSQVIFLDTPGMTTPIKRKKHNLEYTLLTDPHSCLYEADMIIVVVDCSHIWERHQLPVDVLKVLHLHRDKASCLVLNKVDDYPHKQELLHTTRMLTEGVVGGRSDWYRPVTEPPKLKKSKVEDLFDQVDRLRLKDTKAGPVLNGNKSENKSETDVSFDRVNRQDIESGETEQEIDLDQINTIEQLENKRRQIMLNFEKMSAEEKKQNKKLNKELDKLVKRIPKYRTGFKEFRDKEETEHYFVDETEIEQEMWTNHNGTHSSSRKIHFDVINEEEERKINFDAINNDELSETEIAETHALVNKMHVFSSDDHSDRRTSKSTTPPRGQSDSSTTPYDEEAYLEASTTSHPFRFHTSDGKATDEDTKIREFHGYYHLDLKAIGDQIEGKKGFDGFSRVFCTSALTGLSVNDLKDFLVSSARPGSWQFDGSVVTDSDPLEMAEMCMREALLNRFDARIPYVIDIKVKNWGETMDGIWSVNFDLICPGINEKKILLAHRGAKMSAVVQDAKQELMNTFRTEILVRAYVRVKELDVTRWISKRRRKRWEMKQKRR